MLAILLIGFGSCSIIVLYMLESWEILLVFALLIFYALSAVAWVSYYKTKELLAKEEKDGKKRQT